jgi:hypothetical protein
MALKSRRAGLAVSCVSAVGLLVFVVWGFATHDVLRTTKIGFILIGSLLSFFLGVTRMMREKQDK